MFWHGMLEEAMALRWSDHLEQLLDAPDAMEIVQRYPHRHRRAYLEFTQTDLKTVQALLQEAGISPKTVHCLHQDSAKPSLITCIVTAPTYRIINFLAQPLQIQLARLDFPEFTWLSSWMGPKRHKTA